MASSAQGSEDSGGLVASAEAKLQTGLVTLLFTDIVGSTALKQQLGDRVGARLIEQHHQLVRQTLGGFAGGKEIETAGDSFLLTFTTPSEAVTFALLLQGRLRQFNQGQAAAVVDRVGIHLGEVVVREHSAGLKPRDLYGSNVDVCARVMSLAKGGQVLLSRGVFDSARQVLKGEDIEGVGPLEWLNHGPYLLKGLEEAIEICEVRETGREALSPPTSSEKAQRQVRPDEEPVLGWRPAAGQVVPNTRWLLERKLGEGGFGEVWLGRHQTRLEIVAQTADALQAAHDAGVIHRDIKPANILIGGRGTGAEDIQVKLTDFGIGQVVSEECLAGITRAGFTQTILGSSSTSHSGTQLYMAPELVAGKPATIRSDIYSLGVVLYQLLVGNFAHPVTTDWADEIADPLLKDDLKHCFAGKPEDRFAGAGQLAKNLRSREQRKAELDCQRIAQAERERLRQQSERRQRLLAVAAGLAMVLVALAVALSYGIRKAQGEREQQRRLAYAADMSLAQQALVMNDLGRAWQLLEGHRPRRGESDLRGWEWRYLWRECRNDALSELCRCSNGICKVEFAPDGRTLALAAGLVEIWDVPGRRRMATLQTDSAWLVAFSPRGDLLATDAAQGRINIWRVGTTNLVRQITHPDRIEDLKFSPDGTRLASMNYFGEVAIWDVSRWIVILRVPGGRNGATISGVRSISPRMARRWSPGTKPASCASLT